MQLHRLRGWRPLNGRPGLRVAVWLRDQSPVCTKLSLRPTGCTFALTQSVAAAAVCDAISVMDFTVACLWARAGCEYGNQYSWCDAMPSLFCPQYQPFCCKTCTV